MANLKTKGLKTAAGYLDTAIDAAKRSFSRGPYSRGSYIRRPEGGSNPNAPDWLNNWRSEISSKAEGAKKLNENAELYFRRSGSGYVGEFRVGGSSGSIVGKDTVSWPSQAFAGGLEPVPHIPYTGKRSVSSTYLKNLSSTEKQAVEEAMRNNVIRQLDKTMNLAKSGDMQAINEVNWYYVLGDGYRPIIDLFDRAGIARSEAHEVLSAVVALTSANRGIASNTNIALGALSGNMKTNTVQREKILKLLTGLDSFDNPQLYSQKSAAKTQAFAENVLAGIRAQDDPTMTALARAAGGAVTPADAAAVQASRAVDLSGFNRGTIDIHAETALVGLDPTGSNLLNLGDGETYKFAERVFGDAVKQSNWDVQVSAAQAAIWNPVAALTQVSRPNLDLRALAGRLELDPIIANIPAGPERLGAMVARTAEEARSGAPVSSFEIAALEKIIKDQGGDAAIESFRSALPAGYTSRGPGSLFSLAAPVAGLGAANALRNQPVEEEDPSFLGLAVNGRRRPRRRGFLEQANYNPYMGGLS